MSVEFLSLADCRLAYQRQVGTKATGVIFLGGFASDMEGTKARFLADHCVNESIPYLRFDYRGCGQSGGKFEDATLGAWLDDCLAVFDQLTQGPQIVVGSSMGGWLALLLALARPERVAALIGIAPAPDFTEELIWDKLTEAQRDTLLREGVVYDESAPPDHRVPITRILVEEARNHLVFSRPLPLACPLRLIQGMQDKEVPWQHAERIAQHTSQSDVRVMLVKDADHRLARPEDLALLAQTLDEIMAK